MPHLSMTKIICQGYVCVHLWKTTGIGSWIYNKLVVIVFKIIKISALAEILF
ncbi:MAG: hypothetical protein WA057_01160 [Candidatus Magasanikiibacteriota bacterium]